MGLGSGPERNMGGGITLGGSLAQDEGPVRFVNSKGAGGLQKFMEKSGPVYDETLGGLDDAEPVEAVKFKGKVKLHYEETDAEKQRRIFMANLEREPPVEAPRAQVEEKPTFFTSKGDNKNKGLFYSGDFQPQPQPTTSNEAPEEKRVFTNSKKITEVGTLKTEEKSVLMRGWD